MATIDHVTLRVHDLEGALELYTTSFDLLGFRGGRQDRTGSHAWNDFSVARTDATHPPSTGVHIGVRGDVPRSSRGVMARPHDGGVRERRRAGPAARLRGDYFGAFVRDLDDNSIEAVFHDGATAGDAA